MAEKEIHYENFLELDEVMADGYGIVSRKVMRAEFISNNAKALYSYLCSFAGNGNTAFPSTETIKRELSMCKDTFYSARKELASYGIIEVNTVRTRNGARTIYRLCSNATVTEDADETHERTQAIRASKASKADKARASAKGEYASAPHRDAKKARSQEHAICDVPEGFKQLEAISLKKVKPEDYAETVKAYNDAVNEGYHPEQIIKAYQRYIKRYKNEHPDTIRYAKQLITYLTQSDGLSFDANPSKKNRDRAATKMTPERIERERRKIEMEWAHRQLDSSDEEYQTIKDAYLACSDAASNPASNDQARQEAKTKSDELLAKLDDMAEALLANQKEVTHAQYQ